MNEEVIIEEKDLPIVADELLNYLESSDRDRAAVVFLDGDLGAGKTTFSKVLAEKLGVVERVISPTFILKKIYKTDHPKFKSLIHIDAYRFTNTKEEKVLQLKEDIQDIEKIIVIEWPYNLSEITPDIILSLEIEDETKRKLIISYSKQNEEQI